MGDELVTVTETVTRYRRVAAGTDRYNRPTYTETPTTLEGASYADTGSTDADDVDREPTTSTATLYFRDAYPDVVEHDRIIARGLSWDVDGKPARWEGTRHGGLVVRLRRGR